jgi:D-threo-aldose 1-dehydrogenase
MRASDTLRLGKTNLHITRMGLGTGSLGIYHDDSIWDDIFDAAWEAGVRSYDTSPYYGFGNAERRIGKRLQTKPRDEFVLSTKVGRLLRLDAPVDPFAEGVYYPDGMPAGVPRPVYDYSFDGTLRSIEESYERLGIDRVDIVHIHDIIEIASRVSHVNEAVTESFPALARLREEGSIAAIGAGLNENDVAMALAQACDFDCFLLAGLYTLLDQDALDEVLPLCAEKGMGIIIGSPYNSGILYDPTPASTYNYRPATMEQVEKAKAIQSVCGRYGVPLAAAAIQFPFGHSSVAQVLTGAVTDAELAENVRLMELEIPLDMWHELQETGLLRKDSPLPGTSDGGGN